MTDNFARLLALMGAGGGGGTKDYEALTNKPSINGTTLIGDVTLAELGIVVDDQLSTTSTNPVQNAVLTALLNAFPYANVTGKPQINGVTLTGNVTLAELGLNAIWVGTRAELTAALANDEIADGTLIFITDEPDVDNLPTQNSTNLVYSGGVWTALQGKENVFRFATLPTAGQDLEGIIAQYIGLTNANYTNGYFYQCISDASGGTTTYTWAQKNVQPNALAVEEVNTLPTTGIKTNVLYLTPKFAESNGYIDETNGYFYVLTSINTIPVFYRYIYNTGFYDETIRSDESFAEYTEIYIKIQNNTFPYGSCNVQIITGDNKKNEYINLDGTTNGWEKINTDVDGAFSTTSINPVENRVVAKAINEINEFPKVYKTDIFSHAVNLTKTQAQIDEANGIIYDVCMQFFILLEGVHGVDGTNFVDQVAIHVSGLTKDGITIYPYIAFLPDWEIVRVEPYTTTTGAQGTSFAIGLEITFYEPDEVRNLANGESITRAGGDSYSKDANGNITISIPQKFWHFFVTCHYKE